LCYMVADNDERWDKCRREACQGDLANRLAIRFSEFFPASFDLADPFPKEIFAGDVLSTSDLRSRTVYTRPPG